MSERTAMRMGAGAPQATAGMARADPPGAPLRRGSVLGRRGRRDVAVPGGTAVLGQVLDPLPGLPLGEVVLHRVDQLAHELRREVHAGGDDAGDLLLLDLV